MKELKSQLDIDDSVKKRKKAKEIYDKIINYKASSKSEQDYIIYSYADKYEEDDEYIYIKNVLLSEGIVINNPLDYIPRGEIRKAYNFLDSDFNTSIDIGHLDYRQYPIALGEFSKENLEIVTKDDGREELVVTAKLYKNVSLVQDIMYLMQKGYKFGISASFKSNGNYELEAKIYEESGLDVFVRENINLINFSIVGEGANVDSNGLNIYQKGGKDMDFDKLDDIISNYESTIDGVDNLDKINNALTDDTTKEPEAVNDDAQKVNAETVKDNADNDAKDSVKEESVVANDNDAKPENDDDKTDDDDDKTDDDADNEDDKDDDVSYKLNDLSDKIVSITKENEKLKEQVSEYQSQIANYKKEQKEFISKFKSSIESVKKEAQTTTDVSDRSFDELF